MGLLCHNYRATEFQAQILLDQLDHLESDTVYRSENAEYLRKRINAINGFQVQARGRCANLQGYYQFAMTLDPAALKDGIDRAKVCEALRAEGVGVGGGGWGNLMYEHKLWSVPKDMYRVESFEVADDIVKNKLITMSLTWLMLPQNEIEMVADAFEKVMAVYGK